MTDKMIMFFIVILILVFATFVIASSLKPLPRLTDPVAQRIYALTHGNIGFSAKEVQDMLKLVAQDTTK